MYDFKWYVLHAYRSWLQHFIVFFVGYRELLLKGCCILCFWMMIRIRFRISDRKKFTWMHSSWHNLVLLRTTTFAYLGTWCSRIVFPFQHHTASGPDRSTQAPGNRLKYNTWMFSGGKLYWCDNLLTYWSGSQPSLLRNVT